MLYKTNSTKYQQYLKTPDTAELSQELQKLLQEGKFPEVVELGKEIQELGLENIYINFNVAGAYLNLGANDTTNKAEQHYNAGLNEVNKMSENKIKMYFKTQIDDLENSLSIANKVLPQLEKEFKVLGINVTYQEYYKAYESTQNELEKIKNTQKIFLDSYKTLKSKFETAIIQKETGDTTPKAMYSIK